MVGGALRLAAADLAGQVARAAARGEEELAAELPGRLDRRARAETTRAGGLVTARVTVELPLLDVTAFRYRDFGLGIVMMTIGFGAFLGVMIVLPLVLQQVRGVSVLVAGLCLMPAGLLMGLLDD